MMLRRYPLLLAVCGVVWLTPSARAQTWRAMGPAGGDVRALAVDPHDPRVLYLGTPDGHIFGSDDAGGHWKILGRAGRALDSVVTSILVDPRFSATLYASTWTGDPHGESGGVFRSRDGGRHWQARGLAGHAVRALAEAPSDPAELVAGALDGVFLSEDDGLSWRRISPPSNEELRNIDSLAIDPRDPRIIYVGTFHLPWKTVDGGRHWFPIHAGMIDDSDVFSLAVDQRHPRRIFASACSGIYRSEDAGRRWTKIQGVPYSARRTLVVRQDTAHPSTVYAGTTEGLWKTCDGGANWRRMTPSSWVINALVVVPGTGRVVMGTEERGILVSDDGGAKFHASNSGFDHREIVSLAVDPAHPGHVLAVLADAPEAVLATEDGGSKWISLDSGLRAREVRKVYASPAGWWAALEGGGLMRYDRGRGAWVRTGELAQESDPPRTSSQRDIRRGPQPFNFVVNDMAFSWSGWYAATPAGLFVSRDSGASWRPFTFAPLALPVNSVRVSPDGRNFWVVSSRGMVFSRNAGWTWSWHDLPFASGGALRLELVGERTLVVTARRGLYISRDAGAHWTLAAHGLPEAMPEDMAINGSHWVVSMHSGGLFLSEDRGETWSRIKGTLAEGFFPVVAPVETRGVVYAASTSEGLYSVALETSAAGAAEVASGDPH